MRGCRPQSNRNFTLGSRARAHPHSPSRLQAVRGVERKCVHVPKARLSGGMSGAGGRPLSVVSTESARTLSHPFL